MRLGASKNALIRFLMEATRLGNHRTNLNKSTPAVSMAALLPTILSDDEDSALSPKKLNKKIGRAEKEDIETDDESDASSGDEMDGDFEFGGMLVRRCNR